MMDCKSCHSRCKADCCGITPMPLAIFDRNKDKIVQNPERVERFDGPDISDELNMPSISEMKDPSKNVQMVLPVTKNLKCCFLNEDLSCNIYEDRPNICRKFGDESHVYMTCVFQSKDGRIRGRQERRNLVRKCESKLINLNVKI